MAADKNLWPGSAAVLVLKLLEERDMYGYEMIETLARRSDHTFDLKAGTLYPILHSLEREGALTSCERLTREGEKAAGGEAAGVDRLRRGGQQDFERRGQLWGRLSGCGTTAGR